MVGNPQYPSHIRQFIEKMGGTDFIDALHKFRNITQGNPRVWERFYTHNTDVMTPQQRRAYEAWLALKNRGTTETSPFSIQIPSFSQRRLGEITPTYDPTAQATPALQEMENTAWDLRDYWTAFKHYAQYANPIGLITRELPRFIAAVGEGQAEAWNRYADNPLWRQLSPLQQMAVGVSIGAEKYWQNDRNILQYERWLTRQPLSVRSSAWGSKIQALWYEPITFFTNVFGSVASKALYGDDTPSIGEMMMDGFRRSQGFGQHPALRPRGIEMLGEAIEAQHGTGSFFSLRDITYRDREGRLITERIPINYEEKYREREKMGDIKIEKVHDNIIDAGMTLYIGNAKFHALYTPMETLEFIGNPINWAYRPVKLGMGIATGGLKGIRSAAVMFKEGNKFSRIEMLLNSPITISVASALYPIAQAGRAVGLVGRPAIQRAAPLFTKASPVFNRVMPFVKGAANALDNIAANLLPSHYVPEEYFVEGFNADRTLKWWDYMTSAAKANAFDPKNQQQAAEFMMEAKSKFDRIQAQLETIKRMKEVGEDITEAVRHLGDLVDDAMRYSNKADEAKKLADALRKGSDLSAEHLTRLQNLVGDYMGNVPVIVQNVFSRATRLNVGKNWAKAWVRTNAFIQRMSNSRVGRFFFPAYRFADPKGVAAEQFTRLFKNALMGRANELRETVGDLALAFSGSDEYKNTRLYRLHNMLEAKEAEALSEVGIAADRQTEFVDEANDLLRDVGFKPSIFGEVRTPGMEPIEGATGTNRQLEEFLQNVSDAVKSVDEAVRRGVDKEEAALAAAETIHRLQPQFSVPDLKAKLADDAFRTKWTYLTEGSVSMTKGERYQEYWGAMSTIRRLGFTRKQLRELHKAWEGLNEVLGSAPDGVKLRQELGELMLNIANNQVYRPEDIVQSVAKITEGQSSEIKGAVEAAVLSYLNVRRQANVSFAGYTRQLSQLEAVKRANEELQQRRRIIEGIMQTRLQVAKERFQRMGCL